MADIKVSSISLLDNEDSKIKALATITVNDEIALHGIRVVEGEKGAFVQMPQKRDRDGNFNDIFFPITAEMRDTINNAVMDKYKNPVSFDDMQLIGAYETKMDIPIADRVTMLDEGSQRYAEKPETTISQLQEVLYEAREYVKRNEEQAKPETAISEKENGTKSKISASLHEVNGNNTKAAGQIVIDDSIVVAGVKVIAAKGKSFVHMPSYMNSDGDWSQYAHPITKDCYETMNSKVLNAYNNLRATYKGVKYAELGDSEQVFKLPKLNNKFAEKLMAELDKKGIAYHARIEGTTTLSFKGADTEAVKNTEKDLKAALKAQKPENKHGAR